MLSSFSPKRTPVLIFEMTLEIQIKHLRKLELGFSEISPMKDYNNSRKKPKDSGTEIPATK